jgi:hypothetical protein
MARKPRTTRPAASERWYRGADVPVAVIRHFARQVAERFAPERIILFGSYTYGQPHADSDVDILVAMPTRNELDQAFKIHWTIHGRTTWMTWAAYFFPITPRYAPCDAG